MNTTKPFRLHDRLEQVIADGQEVLVFDVSNVWRYGNSERGRIRGTDIVVKRIPGEVIWEVVDDRTT